VEELECEVSSVGQRRRIRRITTISSSAIMASKTGSCSLTKEDRVKLLKNLQAKSAVSGTNHNNEDDDDDNHDDDALPEPLADAVVAPTAESSSTTIEQEDTADNNSYGTGCLCCGEDDDHANILLCEGCNAEYHTYCLDPPLRSVPIGDWYCCELRTLCCAGTSNGWTTITT
jgi:histone demethylase JARID1